MNDDMNSSYERARQAMVQQQLREKGIRGERVLAAMAEVPREAFVRPEDRDSAYEDRALPIESAQTISQPYMVALMTQLLDVHGTDKVLEIGTGSGYQAAVLAKLARHVFTLERHASLSRAAKQKLVDLGLTNVTCVVGDGSKGWRESCPYDRIITTAAAPAIPEALLDQLAEGGKLVIPVGGQDEQVLTVVQRQADRFIEMPGIPCRFVPLIGEQAWPGESGSREPLE